MRKIGFIVLFLCCILSMNAARKKVPAAAQVALKAVAPPRAQAEQLAIDALYLDALKQSLIDHKEEALDLYFQLITKDPNHSVAYYEIARLQTARNRNRDALVFAQRAVELAPENPYYQLLLAEIYQYNGMYAKAGEIYEILIKLYPQNLDYVYELANNYVFQGDLKKVIAVYDNLEKTMGVSEEYSMLKYEMYKSMNDLKSAMGQIESLSKVYPREIKYLEILAEEAMKQKDYKKALPYYKKILEINPDDPYINISLSDYYRKTGDFQNAFIYLTQGVKNPNLDFQTKWTVLQVYAQYMEEGNELKKQANALFSAMVQAHPNEAGANRLYAQFLIRQDKLDTAFLFFERALVLDSTLYSIWESVILLAYIQDDTTKMLDYAARGRNLFPEQATLYFYPASYYYRTKEYDSSVYYAQKARDRNQGVSVEIELQSLLILGDAYYALKNYDKSFACFERLETLFPNDASIQNNYAYYLSLQKKDLEKAEKMMRAICKKNPDNPTYLDTFAWVLFQSGKYKEAEGVLKHAIDKSQGRRDAVIEEHYGDVLYHVGKNQEAIVYWKKAKEKLPNGEENKVLDKKIESGKWIEK